MISMDKTYKTVHGINARILCVDAPGDYPVRALVCESVLSYSANGNIQNCGDLLDRFSLVEVSPYADFKIDEPVMVRDTEAHIWARKFFAGVDHFGSPSTWNGGTMRWTSNGQLTNWAMCRRPTAEELAS